MEFAVSVDDCKCIRDYYSSPSTAECIKCPDNTVAYKDADEWACRCAMCEFKMYKPGEKVLIKNGTLSRSSHHGIHGNKNTNIIIQNLSIKDFEVAGIALNGTTIGILDNIKINN